MVTGVWRWKLVWWQRVEREQVGSPVPRPGSWLVKGAGQKHQKAWWLVTGGWPEHLKAWWLVKGAWRKLLKGWAKVVIPVWRKRVGLLLVVR